MNHQSDQLVTIPVTLYNAMAYCYYGGGPSYSQLYYGTPFTPDDFSHLIPKSSTPEPDDEYTHDIGTQLANPSQMEIDLTKILGPTARRVGRGSKTKEPTND